MPAFRVVAGVQNRDVAFGVDRDGTGGGQVTGQRAQVFPGGAELLHAVVTGVCDVEVAGGVGGDAPDALQLPPAQSPLRRSA